MRTSVVGCGRLGTVLSVSLADLGHNVVAVDTDEAVVERLAAGDAPIEEPGLGPMLTAHAGRHLTATTDHAAVGETAVTYLAHPTPPDENGVDTTAIVAGTRAVGEIIAETDGYHLVVVASPVLPGTTDDKLVPAIEEASGEREGETFGVAVVPAFASEGSAVDDLMEPERIIVGTDGDDRALDLLAEVYEPLVLDWGTPVVETDRRTAEAARYVDSAVRAATQQLGGELEAVCEALGSDAIRAAVAVDVDDQLGFDAQDETYSRDLAALVSASRGAGADPRLLAAVAGRD